MAYIIGQYNKNSTTNSMTKITNNGIAARISSSAEGGTGYMEECLEFNNIFQKGQVYYFHGSVKRLVTRQIFDVILINDNDFDEIQHIKTLKVSQGANGWTDIDFVFKPAKNFNRLAFLLHRTYNSTVYPVFIYQELSKVNDLIPNISNGIPLLKIGVQSEPGCITVINGEEIRVGNTGVLEIRNGFVKIEYFSVVAPAESSSIISQKKQEIDSNYNTTDFRNTTLSTCLFSNGTTSVRNLSDFSLDYIYDKEEN